MALAAITSSCIGGAAESRIRDHIGDDDSGAFGGDAVLGEKAHLADRGRTAAVAAATYEQAWRDGRPDRGSIMSDRGWRSGGVGEVGGEVPQLPGEVGVAGGLGCLDHCRVAA
jgi:hypothetical protein